ncbi:MAG TPA: sn-glycerol-3-phosphate ABC transporter ATP-binding protein UgpC [Microvirga sp.]|jgi:multiple sugar transport system ATP-binding protein|nr:sn-glycerol-3-phosphate ABC transporter ATP-binding protein UgpC [Microvirga sp.]
MSSVTLRAIRKDYGDYKAIKGVDLEVPDGAFLVLLGPSGCGKSTLLRMIAGLEQISSGEISIGGRVVNDVHPKDRNIAMVFQNYALYAHMTVFDNMAFSMQLKGVPKDEIRKRIDWAASILNLQDYLKRYPRQLSGGQRQRVAMGRALVRDPEVFLFDEPLSNLDAKLRVAMRTEIKELHQKLKTTTVYVTHDQIEAMTMADIVVIMRDGVIEQSGKPLDVYDRPANLFVAEFIGSPAMNLLRGQATGQEGRPVLRTEDGIVLPLPAEASVRNGQSLVYGVRPEHLQISSGAEGVEARVQVLVPTGPEIYVYSEVGGTEVCSLMRERIELQPGAPVRLAPRLECIHLFDAETGRRLEHA